MSKPEELRRLADVAAQVLRDMQAQDVLLEWQTLLEDALREYAESLEREPVAWRPNIKTTPPSYFSAGFRLTELLGPNATEHACDTKEAGEKR